MSRIGKQPISIPSGVEVSIEPDLVRVKGKLGELTQAQLRDIEVKIEGDQVIISRKSDDPKIRSFHGLMRSLIQNMIIGVSEGYKKELEMVGVGYRAALVGNKLSINAGFSHSVEVDPPEGIFFEVQNNTNIIVSGISKEKVGQVAANIRLIRKPEPYKGKGIRYKGEYVKRKPGKAAKTASA